MYGKWEKFAKKMKILAQKFFTNIYFYDILLSNVDLTIKKLIIFFCREEDIYVYRKDGRITRIER